VCEKKKCCDEADQGCQKPENLKGRPEECSPEQIQKCHGTGASHPCVPEADDSD